MNILFMGTPDFAVPSLRMLMEEGYNVIAVVTQPDRPKGRKRVLTPPPVKVEAERYGLPVLQPERLRREPEAVAEIAALKPDLIVTAAFGQILPKDVLDLPKHGCINVHGSLLPKYRGGAPIQHAVLNGEKETGVTIMYMAEGLDTGDMLSRVAIPITEEDTTGTLFEKLSLSGADLLKATLPDLLAGRITPVPQKEEEATYAPNIKREDERLDWTRSAEELFNQVRGLNPWPVAFTLWNGEVFKVWSSRKSETKPSPKQAEAEPGTVLKAEGRGIEVLTGDGILVLTEIQPAGKKAMDAATFNRGSGIAAGTVLGR
ncbi:methionyl-tRNA formyltransferase [Paenibacillus aurantius]|uniref:Methionyl-tRNA formyltransferase n=1 Tax=Paenibacillus aurantius TaxID=2918900 RepID=A0AA96LKC0_9BACL|nr:methionyl-tRNA formyltransferase [Paenibacillus aurantius]WNQ13670.1 methionyl-tRNA formyltransferase [Paenibacillus aurantius]